MARSYFRRYGSLRARKRHHQLFKYSHGYGVFVQGSEREGIPCEKLSSFI